MGTHPIFESDFDCLTDMLDFFSIFTKGGLVLWYFQAECFKINLEDAINQMIRSAIIDKNQGVFHYNQTDLEYKMDNEFELVCVVGYQNFQKISYIDRLLNEIMIRFRDMYKNQLDDGFLALTNTDFSKFGDLFQLVLKKIENEARHQKPNKPRTFSQSEKASKTVGGSGLIEKKEWKDELEKKNEKYSKKNSKKEMIDDDTIEENIKKLMSKGKKNTATSPKTIKKTKTKQARKWDLEGKKKDELYLDYGE